MKKSLTVAFMLLSTTALAQGKWNIGASVGWSISRARETVNTIDRIGHSRYKFNLKGNGGLVGLSAGYAFPYHRYSFEFGISGYRDVYASRNQGNKPDTLTGNPALTVDSKNDLKRNHTWETSAKVGKYIDPTTQLYGRLGAVRSVFREQYADPDNDVKGRTHGWGGLLGVGIQKEFEHMNLGIGHIQV
jgi:hypothetical protein